MKLALIFALVGSLAVSAHADHVDWESHLGLWRKDGFNRDTMEKSVYSASGLNRVTFELRHAATSRDLFSYSKWEAERWGDPEGVLAPKGSWQAVSNAANNASLTLWGYWGWDGAASSPRPAAGESTSYVLTLRFATPVRDLRLPIHGINALLSGEVNSIDSVSLRAFRDGTELPTPTLTKRGAAIVSANGGLAGDWTLVVNSPTSDDSSAEWLVSGPADKMEIVFTNRAEHPTPSAFKNGTQPWSFALGDLTFENESQRAVTVVDFASQRGQLEKPGFDTATASHQMNAGNGAARVTFTLEHLGTTPGLGSYSKWEIDRWGDPTGQAYTPGSWQVVTNGANDVVLACWGYWGWPLETGGPKVRIGDSTTYRLRMAFERPVTNLRFQLNGLNGFIKEANGFNSCDHVSLACRLNGAGQTSPTYANAGPSFTRSGDTMTGNYLRQIEGGVTGQHVSNDGSLEVRMAEPVDLVEITLANLAGHYDPAKFQDGTQTWSFSVGSISFTEDLQAPALVNHALHPGAKATQSSQFGGYAEARLAKDGNANGNFWARSVAHTHQENEPWWELDLGAVLPVDQVRVWKRTDGAADPSTALRLFASAQPFASKGLAATASQAGVLQTSVASIPGANHVWTLGQSIRYLRVQKSGQAFLELAEVEVLGTSANADVPGLSYRAFEGVWPDWPNFSSAVPVAGGTAADFPFAPKPRPAFVAMEYRGFVNVPQPGTYAFSVNVANSQFTIGGVPLWQNNAAAGGTRSGSTGLSAGWQPFLLQTYERASSEPTSLRWSGPGLANQAIPASAIKQDGSSFSTTNNPAPNANEDADLLTNFQEYALGQNPSVARHQDAGFRLERAGERVDAIFRRPVGLAARFVYTLETSANATAWTAASAGQVTPLGDGTETVRFSNLSGAFARLRVDAAALGLTSRTETLGWRKVALRAGYQTHGVCLTKSPVFASVIGEAGNLGSFAYYLAPVAGGVSLDPAKRHYVEITSGVHEGHRFEVDANFTTDQIVALYPLAETNTLRSLPANGLAGASFVIRPHWTVNEVYDRALFRANADPAAADELLFFRAGAYESLSLASVGLNTRWTASSDNTLADAGGRIIPPGAGAFLRLGAAPAASLIVLGHVRENDFAQPLDAGYNLLAEPYPFASSPRSRGLEVANGFLGSNDPSLADQIYRWAPDVSGASPGYLGSFLLNLGAPATRYWSSASDAALPNQSDSPLFQPDRAVFLRLVSEPHLSYRVTR